MGSLSCSFKQLAGIDYPAARWSIAIQHIPSALTDCQGGIGRCHSPTPVCLVSMPLMLFTSCRFACSSQLSRRPSAQNMLFTGCGPFWPQEVIAGIDGSGGSTVMHLVTAQHAPGTLGNMAFPHSRRALWGNRPSLLLVTGVPWPPACSHYDLLVGKDNILTNFSSVP